MNDYRLSRDAARDLDGIWEFIAGEYLDNIDTADRFIRYNQPRATGSEPHPQRLLAM